MSGSEKERELYNFPFAADYSEAAEVFNSVQHEVDLGSYETPDAEIVQRLIRLNRNFLPAGQFFDRFANLLTKQQEPTEEELFDLGVDVGASIYTHDHSPKGLALGYLNTWLRMNTLGAGLVGQENHRADAAYLLMDYACMQVAETLPFDDATNNMFGELAQSLARARLTTDPRNAAVFTLSFNRLHQLQRVWLTSKEFRDYSVDLFATNKNYSDEEQLAVDKGVGLLTQEAMKHRKYGTKPAYTESSAGGVWLFYDGDDWRNMLLAKQGTTMTPHVAAIVMHIPELDLSTIDLRLEGLSLGSMGQVQRNGAGIAVANSNFSIAIQQNGSMSLDYEGLQPLEVVMADDRTALQRLKAEIASNFYDLSMPIDMGARPAHNYAQMTPEERREFDPIRQLLIPRLRYLQNSHESVDETSKIVRRHDVTWYVRPLPPGWHASPEAAKLAEEVGVVLKPNETFVKKHERGSGEKILGYHAVRRAIDLEPGRDY